MLKNKIGFFFVIIFFCVSFSQLHQIIPGLKHIKLALIAAIFLAPIILSNLFKRQRFGTITFWRILFSLSIIPGIFFGFSTRGAFNDFLLMLIDFFVGFLGIVLYVKTLKQIQFFMKVLIFSSLLIAIWTIYHNGHGPGILDDENDVALVMVMLLPFSFFGAMHATKIFKKISLYGIFGVVLIGIASTISRGGMVGCIPSILYIWLKSKNKFFTSLILTSFFLLAIFLGPKNLENEFVSISKTNEGTAATRTYYWSLSWKIFLKNPIWGVGATGWSNAVWSQKFVSVTTVRNTTPHSVYFQLMSELGLIGIIAWCGLILSTFRQIRSLSSYRFIGINNENKALLYEEYKILKSLSDALGIGLLGGLICGVFLSFLFYQHIYAFCALAQAVCLVWQNRLMEIAEKNESSKLTKKNQSPVLLAC